MISVFGNKSLALGNTLARRYTTTRLDAFGDMRLDDLMQASEFDEAEFFRRIALSGARALFIGRRALIALGLPVLTADYDFWIAIDDIVLFNGALSPMDFIPTCAVEQARTRGRYALENSEHVDVLVSRSQPLHAPDGTVERLEFESAWQRRQLLNVAPAVRIAVPSLDDLIRTKRFALRAKDAQDIRLLSILAGRKPPE